MLVKFFLGLFLLGKGLNVYFRKDATLGLESSLYDVTEGESFDILDKDVGFLPYVAITDEVTKAIPPEELSRYIQLYAKT